MSTASTDAQVQANFFVYVSWYLLNNGLTVNAVDFTNFQSDQFTIGQDSNGYYIIQSWTPLSVSQPSETDLQSISPNQISTLQRRMKTIMLSNSQPIIYQILFDQQNQIRAQQSLTPYTDDQYKSYVATLNF